MHGMKLGNTKGRVFYESFFFLLGTTLFSWLGWLDLFVFYRGKSFLFDQLCEPAQSSLCHSCNARFLG